MIEKCLDISCIFTIESVEHVLEHVRRGEEASLGGGGGGIKGNLVQC